MATQIITLPPMIQTSSAVDLSTQTVQTWDTSDCQGITIGLSGTTTAPGPQVQVAFTSESTATFFPLSYNSSAMSQVITSSLSAVTISPVSFKQTRVVTTAVHTGTTTHLASKLVHV